MTARLDKAEVLGALGAEAVLAHFGIEFQRRGDELRCQVCPGCGPRTRRDAVAINSDTGRWCDHAHGCRGDLFDLVAGLAGLDIERDFGAVLAVAAELAGVNPVEASDERRRHLAELRARREAEEAARSAEREEARARAAAAAPGIWARLNRTSKAGLAYLRRRGVEAARGDVRFGRRSVCIPLRDAAGAIVNVVGRLFVEDPRAPKIRGLAGCSTAGTFGDLGKADTTTGPVVIVEGLMDWLSARVLWPDRLNLGAHGAGRLPHVAELAAPLARKRGVLLVPHADDAGQRYCDRAIAALVKGGVEMGAIQLFLVEAGDKDLNDQLRRTR